MNYPVKFLALGAILVFSILYLWGAVTQAYSVNTVRYRTDQSRYMTAIEMTYEDPLYFGDRNRMPLYVQLQTLFYRPEMSRDISFATGKLVNIGLSVLCVAMVAWITFRKLRPVHLAVSFTLVAAFNLFMLRAGYLQVEVVFYTFLFLTFIKCLDLLKAPTIRTGLIVGALSGITYLLKGTVMLNFYLLIGFFAMLLGLSLWRDRKQKRSKYRVQIANIVKPFLALVVVFLIITGPYLYQNIQMFGMPFYNVNTNFYIWFDEWADAGEWEVKQDPNTSYPDLPPEEMPSLQNYLRDHDLQDIVQRMKAGILEQRDRLFNGYSSLFTKYIIAAWVAMLAFVVIRRQDYRKILRQNIIPLSYALSFLILFFAALCWYAPIAWGPRMIMTIYLPTLYLPLHVISLGVKEEDIQTGGIFDIKSKVAWLGIGIFIGVLLSDLYLLMTDYIVGQEMSG